MSSDLKEQSDEASPWCLATADPTSVSLQLCPGVSKARVPEGELVSPQSPKADQFLLAPCGTLHTFPITMVDKRSVRKAQHRILTLEFLGDLGATVFALVAAYAMRFKTVLVNYGNANPHQEIEPYFPLLFIATVFFMSAFAYLGMYSNRRILHLHRNISSIVKGSTFWLFMFLSLSLAIKFEPQVSRGFVALSYISVISYLIAWRWVLHKILIRTSFVRDFQQKIVLFGYNETSRNIIQTINKDKNLPYYTLGFVTTDTSDPVQDDTHVMGTEDELASILKNNPVNILVIAENDVSNERMVQIAQICEKHHVDFKITPSSFQVFISGLQLQSVSGIPLLGVEDLPINRYLNRVIKRVIDFSGGLFGCIISAPVIALFAILIKLEDGGPAFFYQERTGERGRLFKIIKLRSMKLGSDKDDDKNQSTQRKDPRMSKIGKFMRERNIDELPQFWNILRGQMSLVGPRPERTFHVNKLVDEIPHYGLRHIVKPGLTGWAQINGLRGNTSLVNRIQHDIFYIENWSIWLDVYILSMTLIKRKNAY